MKILTKFEEKSPCDPEHQRSLVLALSFISSVTAKSPGDLLTLFCYGELFSTEEVQELIEILA